MVRMVSNSFSSDRYHHHHYHHSSHHETNDDDHYCYHRSISTIDDPHNLTTASMKSLTHDDDDDDTTTDLSTVHNVDSRNRQQMRHLRYLPNCFRRLHSIGKRRKMHHHHHLQCYYHHNHGYGGGQNERDRVEIVSQLYRYRTWRCILLCRRSYTGSYSGPGPGPGRHTSIIRITDEKAPATTMSSRRPYSPSYSCSISSSATTSISSTLNDTSTPTPTTNLSEQLVDETICNILRAPSVTSASSSTSVSSTMSSTTAPPPKSSLSPTSDASGRCNEVTSFGRAHIQTASSSTSVSSMMSSTTTPPTKSPLLATSVARSRCNEVTSFARGHIRTASSSTSGSSTMSSTTAPPSKSSHIRTACNKRLISDEHQQHHDDRRNRSRHRHHYHHHNHQQPRHHHNYRNGTNRYYQTHRYRWMFGRNFLWLLIVLICFDSGPLLANCRTSSSSSSSTTATHVREHNNNSSNNNSSVKNLNNSSTTHKVTMVNYRNFSNTNRTKDSNEPAYNNRNLMTAISNGPYTNIKINANNKMKYSSTTNNYKNILLNSNNIYTNTNHQLNTKINNNNDPNNYLNIATKKSNLKFANTTKVNHHSNQKATLNNQRPHHHHHHQQKQHHHASSTKSNNSNNNNKINYNNNNNKNNYMTSDLTIKDMTTTTSGGSHRRRRPHHPAASSNDNQPYDNKSSELYQNYDVSSKLPKFTTKASIMTNVPPHHSPQSPSEHTTLPPGVTTSASVSLLISLRKSSMEESLTAIRNFKGDKISSSSFPSLPSEQNVASRGESGGLSKSSVTEKNATIRSTLPDEAEHYVRTMSMTNHNHHHHQPQQQQQHQQVASNLLRRYESERTIDNTHRNLQNNQIHTKYHHLHHNHHDNDEQQQQQQDRMQQLEDEKFPQWRHQQSPQQQQQQQQEHFHDNHNIHRRPYFSDDLDDDDSQYNTQQYHHVPANTNDNTHRNYVTSPGGVDSEHQKLHYAYQQQQLDANPERVNDNFDSSSSSFMPSSSQSENDHERLQFDENYKRSILASIGCPNCVYNIDPELLSVVSLSADTSSSSSYHHHHHPSQPSSQFMSRTDNDANPLKQQHEQQQNSHTTNTKHRKYHENMKIHHNNHHNNNNYPNNYIDTTNTASLGNSNFQQSFHQFDSDQIRLESIKHQILTKLGLKTKPNVTQTLPKQFIMETIYRAESSGGNIHRAAGRGGGGGGDMKHQHHSTINGRHRTNGEFRDEQQMRMMTNTQQHQHHHRTNNANANSNRKRKTSSSDGHMHPSGISSIRISSSNSEIRNNDDRDERVSSKTSSSSSSDNNKNGVNEFFYNDYINPNSNNNKNKNNRDSVETAKNNKLVPPLSSSSLSSSSPSSSSSSTTTTTSQHAATFALSNSELDADNDDTDNNNNSNKNNNNNSNDDDEDASFLSNANHVTATQYDNDDDDNIHHLMMEDIRMGAADASSSSSSTTTSSSSHHSASTPEQDDYYGRTKEIITFAEKGDILNGHRLVEFTSLSDQMTGQNLRIRAAWMWIRVDVVRPLTTPSSTAAHNKRTDRSARSSPSAGVPPSLHHQPHSSTTDGQLPYQQRNSSHVKRAHQPQNGGSSNIKVWVFRLIEPYATGLNLSEFENKEFDQITTLSSTLSVQFNQLGWQKLDITQAVQSWYANDRHLKLRLLIDCSGCGDRVTLHLFDSDRPNQGSVYSMNSSGSKKSQQQQPKAYQMHHKHLPHGRSSHRHNHHHHHHHNHLHRHNHSKSHVYFTTHQKQGNGSNDTSNHYLSMLNRPDLRILAISGNRSSSSSSSSSSGGNLSFDDVDSLATISRDDDRKRAIINRHYNRSSSSKVSTFSRTRVKTTPLHRSRHSNEVNKITKLPSIVPQVPKAQTPPFRSSDDNPEPNRSSKHKRDEVDPNRPFLVIHTEPGVMKRVRRRALDCSGALNGQCCKESFYVSFKALGWDDWIIAPHGYFANYCRGDCSGPRTPDTYQSYHTHVIEEFRKLDRLTGMQPCCAPLKFSSMSLIYYGKEGIIKRDLPKMVVDECGCP